MADGDGYEVLPKFDEPPLSAMNRSRWLVELALTTVEFPRMTLKVSISLALDAATSVQHLVFDLP